MHWTWDSPVFDHLSTTVVLQVPNGRYFGSDEKIRITAVADTQKRKKVSESTSAAEMTQKHG
jgi:hypothetical protein